MEQDLSVSPDKRDWISRRNCISISRDMLDPGIRWIFYFGKPSAGRQISLSAIPPDGEGKDWSAAGKSGKRGEKGGEEKSLAGTGRNKNSKRRNARRRRRRGRDWGARRQKEGIRSKIKCRQRRIRNKGCSRSSIRTTRQTGWFMHPTHIPAAASSRCCAKTSSKDRR